MGGSKTICTQFPLGTSEMVMKCKYGNFSVANATFGLIPNTSSTFNKCMYTEGNTECANDVNTLEAVKTALQACDGNATCNFKDPASIFMATSNENSSASCRNTSNTYVFVQIPCVMTYEVMNTRQVQGLFIGSMGVFIALFFVVFIDYLRSTFKNTFIEWDVKTITAGDYSVEMDISESMYKNFLSTKYDPLSGKTKIAAFRDYLQEEMETRLTRLPDLGYEEVPPERIRVAMLSFAFDNAELINLLRQRGQFIKVENYDKMREINDKIDNLKSNPEKLEKFYRPVTAFFTFENEEGLNRCTNYNEAVMADNQYSDIRTLLGEPLDIEEASEPTDIIWENRHFTSWERLKRSLIVCGIVFLLLGCSFLIIFSLTQTSTTATNQYPSSSCTDIDSIFTGETMKSMVKQEQTQNEFQISTGADSNPIYTYTTCFCKN
jgi:hypothetical protein